MSQLSDSMLMSLMREGATIILPREGVEESTLEDSFKNALIKRRKKVLPITMSVVPSPVPG